MELNAPAIKRLIKDCGLYLCQECGKCSASCPRFLSGREYSPRQLAQKLITQPGDRAYIENAVWECLSCGLCEQRCPSNVRFTRFIRELRAILATDQGLMGHQAHDGALHSWMRIMTAPDLRQDRLGWLTPELKTDPQSEVAFFSGCAPYFDVFFANIKVDTLGQARDAIRLLNFLAITPQVLANERCCGHDLLWSGDAENFAALARLNLQEFRDRGVKEIVTACPECFQALGTYLPRVAPGGGIKVTFLLDLVEREVKKGGIFFRPLARRVTYQDPCRLGRMSGRYQGPRDLMAMIPGLELTEMANHRQGSICCGNSAFLGCDAYSKRIQVARLNQARETGAELLVTACPKCLIHTTCALRDPVRGQPWSLKPVSLVSLLADHIQWSSAEKSRREHD